MINEKLMQELLKTFKNQSNLNQSIQNYEIYNFSEFNSSQVQKIFKTESNTIFKETNSKKHLTKILDIIKNTFQNPKTNHYTNIFLNPTKQKAEYEKRKKAFQSISKLTQFPLEKNNQLKQILKQIELFNTKISFNKTIYTLSQTIRNTLYDNFKISAHLIDKKELEEMISFQTPDFILITDEEIFAEIEVFSLKDFIKIIKGNIIKKNEKQIIELIKLLAITKNSENQILQSIETLTSLKLEIDLEYDKLKTILEQNTANTIKEITTKVLKLDEEVQKINYELKQIISKKKLSLDGEELLQVLNSGSIETLQNKFDSDTKEIKQTILKKEKELIEEFKQHKISIDSIFSNSSYPLALDENTKNQLLKQIDIMSSEIEIETYKKLGEFNYKNIKNLWNYAFWFDFFYGISKFTTQFSLNYPKISDKLIIQNGKNIYIQNAMPISYGLGTDQIKDTKLTNKDKISILTGANSGGKTTLLEMFLQSQILTHMGLGIPADKESQIKLFDEVIYLKKFTGTQGSGAFEQTIRNLIQILDTPSSKLILIDEFEAITEPGAAAKILIEFLKQLSKQDNYCIAVSHLGQEIQEFIKEQNIKGIRIDGISAEGLDENANLITNHQPQFNQLGKSTPELILKRILQDKKFWQNKSKQSKEILKKII